MDVAQQIMHLHYEASRRGKLSAWTIYDHPSDFPDDYVARRFEYDQPTSDMIVGELDQMRKAFLRAGLVCMTRDQKDDPKIVETWL
jgi:hypothetical protein